MAKKKTLRRRAPNGEVREMANRAVARFLLSNPAPYGGQFWEEHDVSVHGYYMFMAGYRAAQRKARKEGK